MADFVAVIRKAVDGLANNTPENRAKVYDKARSAVVRQLENMKPRPPEELLNRQILKLDTAIAEVESEYSEALPAEDEEQDDAVPAAVVPADVSSPYYEESVAEEQRSYQDEPEHEQAAQTEAEVEEYRYAEPEDDRQTPETVNDERYEEPEPVAERDAPEQVEADQAYTAARDEAPTYFTTATEEPRYAPENEEPIADHETVAAEDHAHRDWIGEDTPTQAPWDELQDEQRTEPTAELDAGHSDDADGHHIVHETAPSPYATDYAAQTPYYQEVSAQPGVDDHHATEPVFEDEDRREPVAQSETPAKPTAVVEDFSTYFQDAALDLPAKTTPGLPRADNDPFAAPAAKDDKERTPWDDLEELIGYDGSQGSSAGNANKSEFDSGISADGIPAAVYRTKKKPRRNYAKIALALFGVVILAGGGYAMWTNRDALNDMVGGLVQSAQTDPASTPPAENTSAPADTTATAPVTPPATGSEQANTPTPPAASDDGSVTGTKFTQRLLADGSERDEGPGAGTNGQPVTAEGQSVYEQNEAAPAATASGAAPDAAGQQPAAAATGDRIFLYEEVLGQTVPTAIEGRVAWSLQSEQDAEGRPSATVQGQINIPGRGLSALITFKRNTDASLPASHLVEIVFSVTTGFEGGAIDSVQRIAMKRTEQDRGNALIAVPAKITDDFHMIALNDFPDALRTNLDLLRTRDWIDIPVSYRNGRRALLTLQKGADGKTAFDNALREWTAAAPATGQ